MPPDINEALGRSDSKAQALEDAIVATLAGGRGLITPILGTHSQARDFQAVVEAFDGGTPIAGEVRRVLGRSDSAIAAFEAAIGAADGGGGVGLIPIGVTSSAVVGQPVLGAIIPAVTALTLDTATPGILSIAYEGTYLPADLSPAPTIIMTAIRGGSDIASENADTVGGGSYSGTITVSAGSSTTLRAEALGEAEDESDPVTVT